MWEESAGKAAIALERQERRRRPAIELERQGYLLWPGRLLARQTRPDLLRRRVNKRMRQQTNDHLRRQQKLFKLVRFSHGRAAIEIVGHGDHREQKANHAHQRDPSGHAFFAAGPGDEAQAEEADYTRRECQPDEIE